MLVIGVQMLSARSPPLVVVACMVSLPSCLPPLSCFIAARLLHVGYCWIVECCIILYMLFFSVIHLPKIQWSKIHYFPLTCSGLKVLNHKMKILQRHKPAVSQLTQIQANNSHCAP